MPRERGSFVKSLRAQWLGARLREHRERLELSLQDIVPIIGHALSTLSKYERADWPIPMPVLMTLMDVYGIVSERERDLLVETCQHAWRVNRWDADTEPADSNLPFIAYPWVQDRAEEICLYASTCVPKLLQSRPYLDALARITEEDVPVPEFKVRQRVERDTELQSVLDAKPAVSIRAIIEESVLHRPVGGVSVLQDQLEHLGVMIQRPNVAVQVLPAEVGQHPALDGPFTLLRMRGGFPPVVYLEHLGGRLFLETTRANRYVRVYEHLLKSVLSPDDSAKHIARLAASVSPGARMRGA